MKKTLEEVEIKEALNLHQIQNDWIFSKGFLHAEFQFDNFREAWQFMTNIAFVADSMDHHPNWSNVYAKVMIDLNTHSAGGISELDIELAKNISSIWQSGAYKTLHLFKDE